MCIDQALNTRTNPEPDEDSNPEPGQEPGIASLLHINFFCEDLDTGSDKARSRYLTRYRCKSGTESRSKYRSDQSGTGSKSRAEHSNMFAV
jgi:hypothetical protein